LARHGFEGLRHLAGLRREIHAFDDEAPRAAARGAGRGRNVSTVAVIPVIGMLTHRVEAIGSVSQTRSTAAIVSEVREALAEPNVDAVVLQVDSPGGSVSNVQEAWAAIHEGAKAKPIVASVNSLAASAAYHLASAATEIWMTPSGMVGSVGVYALHVDASKALEEMGEAWEFIVAKGSPFKVEGNPAGPLTGEARKKIQADIDAFMDVFVRDLARGRGTTKDAVRQGYGQGRTLLAGPAKAAGMVDQIGTLEDAIRRASQLAGERRTGMGPQGARVAFVEPSPAPETEPPAPEVPLASDEPPVPAVEPEEPAETQDARRRLWESA
ncbi:hypothetical protein LCGC14_2095270, partial [marine sediment metagenome]